MKMFPALLVCLMIATIIPLPGRAQEKKAEASTEALVTRLTELEAEGVGISSGVSGSDFPPVAGQFSFQMGIIAPRPSLHGNDVLTKLVSLGAEALPSLLRHLDDKRETKLVISASGFIDAMWYGVEMDSARYNETEQQALKKAGVEEEQKARGQDDGTDKHPVTVGDVCFVAIGMITNRGYTAVRYQPTGCLVINSPVHSPVLAAAVRNIWGPAGEQATRERLLAWLREDFRRGSPGAAVRMLYYFPEETPDEILKILREPKGAADSYLLSATAWTPHGGIRAEVQKIVLSAGDAALARAGAAAFGGGKDPADYEHLTHLITRWKKDRQGTYAADAFFRTSLAAWPDRRQETLQLYFRNASLECLTAGAASCYGFIPLPVPPLVPMLSRQEAGYGRYLIQGEGVWEKPEDDDLLDYRLCDNFWEAICRSLGDTNARCTGDRSAMDRRIQELQARLKRDVAAWSFTPAEVEARQAEQNQAARAKAAALREIDSKKPAPAERALLILQADGAGTEQWIKSAARLLHPAADNDDGWGGAFANRNHSTFRKRLFDELTSEQRGAFEKCLTQRTLAALNAAPRNAWPGENATAFVCLTGCLTKDAGNPALKAALERWRTAFAANGWPKDRDLSRLIKILECFAERRTPGTGALLLHLAQTSNAEKLGMSESEFFAILAESQNIPECVKALEYCFLNRKSPWHLSKCGYSMADEYGNARLLQAPVFRKALAAALSVETVVGTLKIDADKPDYCWVEWKRGSSGRGIVKDDPVGVKPGETMNVRTCDALLEGVHNAVFSGYQGPDFKIYWPLEKRNAARKEWLEYLAKPQ
ncbi:MAG TPA: hypothetical protein VG796_12840 [Verrucomicrobiales bacterium]|nr:hypothetical protein [Verrucomicrobiales bacterium]